MRQLLTVRIHTAALLNKHLWAALPFLFTPYLLACDNTTPAPTVVDMAMPDLAMPVVVRDMAMPDLFAVMGVETDQPRSAAGSGQPRVAEAAE